MKKLLTLSAALLVAAAGAAHGQSGQPAQKPAASTAQPAPAANTDLLVKGLRDGLGGGQPLLNDEEIQATMQSFQQQVMAQQEAKKKALGDKNKTEGEAFLAKNKARPGVKTTASGLQYEVLTEGTGPTPKATDTVTVNYKGTLMDGTTFDSSYDRHEPATFVLNQVIPGWTEGVQLMKVGSKYKFYIPAALGYAERGAGNVIGPNAPLVFEVELVSIGQPTAPAAASGEAKPQAATPKPPGPKPSNPKPADKKPPV
jgi:FKBP-type peptidyl-prolyl cis-trans isomerase